MTKLISVAVLAAVSAFGQAAQNPLTQAYMTRYSAVKQNLIESAEAMPADQYEFKLTPAQRSFAGWIDHTVMLNHNTCSAMKGAAPAPMNHAQHAAEKPKAELAKALRESFTYCDDVLKEMTDQKALNPIGEKKAYAVTAMFAHIANLNSHYGNLVGYMRTKGVVPPSTARTMKK